MYITEFEDSHDNNMSVVNYIPGLVIHTCNTSTPEAECRGLYKFQASLGS